MIRFSPDGALDISTDPQDLPEQGDGKNSQSGAMTRCTNMSLDRPGIASTRYGSRKLNATPIDPDISLIVEQSGNRTEFAGSTIYLNETEIETGLATRDSIWFAMQYSAYNVMQQDIFALNGTNRVRVRDDVVTEWGIAAPTVAPVLTSDLDYAHTYDWEPDETDGDYFQKITTTRNDYEGLYDWEYQTLLGLYEVTAYEDEYAYCYGFEVAASHVQNIVYFVKYTYCRKDDDDVLECESNPSPPAGMYLRSCLGATYSQPTDDQVTHVRFYRTLGDGGDFYYAGEVEIAEEHIVLERDDLALGTLVETDHDRPPVGGFTMGPDYNGSCFILRRNQFWFCKPKQPEYWPPTYYVEVGSIQDQLKAGAILSGQVFVASERQIYQIQGTGALSFYPLEMSAQCGTVAKRCFLAVSGHGIYHLGPNGLYLFRVGGDENVTDQQFAPIFRGETVGSIPGMRLSQIARCWLIHYGGKLWFGYPSGTSNYPCEVLVMNLATKRTVHYSFPFEVRGVCVDGKNRRLLGADERGYVHNLDDSTAKSDHGTEIAWQIETKEFGGLRKYFPRYARYDVKLDSGAIAAGSVLLDGNVEQTHALTESRQTRKRLIRTCAGDRLSVRISGTGRVDIYGAEVE